MPYIRELEDLKLRVNDTVKYVGTETHNLIGKEGTIVAARIKGRSVVLFEDAEKGARSYPYNRNLALWTPDYRTGDIVRITPRDGTLTSYAGLEGVVGGVDEFNERGTHRVFVSLRHSDSGESLAPFARNLTLLAAADDRITLHLSDVVRIGTEVGVLRALPSDPNGLYEVEMTNGDTMHVTRETMEKIT